MSTERMNSFISTNMERFPKYVKKEKGVTGMYGGGRGIWIGRLMFIKEQCLCKATETGNSSHL